MRRSGGRVSHRGLGIAAALACLALAGTAPAAAPPDPTLLRTTFSGLPDYLDPQLTYTSEGWTFMYPVYVPLLTYRHAAGREGSEVVPGLAKAMPKVGNGGRTYTLFLRQGLKYSNGAPVRASDFEYAIKRTIKLNSGGSVFYLDIVGAGRYARLGKGDISGIVTDNKTGLIQIRLARPRTTFLDNLAMFFAAPVPPTTPISDRTFDPPPATGPYAITDVAPEGWTFRRNPAWGTANSALLPEIPGGHVERIEVTLLSNEGAQLGSTLAGRFDWMANLPPSNRLPELRREYGGTQFRLETTLNVYYFWMNTERAPFNDPRVRRAVNHALDPKVMKRIYAGQIAPTQQILPPGLPGYSKFVLYPYDMAKARRLISAASPRDRNVTIWADTERPHAKAAAYYRDQLRKLGFHARLKIEGSENYFVKIGNQRTPNLDTGWSNWFADYAHPDDFFRPILTGPSILPVNNSNLARFDVPSIDRQVEALAVKPLGASLERSYAALDRRVMTLAPWAPYGNLTVPTVVSKRVDLDKVVWNPVIGADLTSFQFD